jgi:hypothetical protein
MIRRRFRRLEHCDFVAVHPGTRRHLGPWRSPEPGSDGGRLDLLWRLRVVPTRHAITARADGCRGS